MERLQKIIAKAGIASRRKAEELIRDGRIQVNGHVVTKLGTKVNAERDHIRVDGKLIKRIEPKQYILLYKPKGFITTKSDPQGRPTVIDLVPRAYKGIFPVGRLDYDAEGLLILTNDGDFAERVIHPRNKVPRTYLVKISGVPHLNELIKLRKGVDIGGKMTLPAKVYLEKKFKSSSLLKVILYEGSNRQIKRMFAKFNYEVIGLKRIGFGRLRLGTMKPGESRILKNEEIRNLALS